MPIALPPVPIKAKPLDQSGYLSQAWSYWFLEMFRRIGGINALSNSELELLQIENVEEIESDIDTLQVEMDAQQALTASHTSQLLTLSNDIQMFLQGPNL